MPSLKYIKMNKVEKIQSKIESLQSQIQKQQELLFTAMEEESKKAADFVLAESEKLAKDALKEKLEANKKQENMMKSMEGESK